MHGLIATFPSPSTGELDIGPVSIHMYGITLLVAIVAAIALTGWRWTRRGGDWDLVLRAAVWGVAAGIVGARLYHVVTNYDQLPDEWYGPVAVWEGGLGVWGGILFGCIAGGIVVWRSGESVALFADCLAPALLLAQGIGRWGNWWNQELFGEPTDLPWALDIDPEHCPQQYNPDFASCSEDFHPIFLYEFAYDLIGVGVLLLVERLWRIRPPGLFALYVAWYTFGRIWEEQLRRPVARFSASGSTSESLSPCSPSRRRSSSGGSSSASTAVTGRRSRPGRTPQGRRWPCRRAASPARLASRTVEVRGLDVDLDAFEGPFDLLWR
jgi:prolipoprotein diacylglyceryl transferase